MSVKFYVLLFMLLPAGLFAQEERPANCLDSLLIPTSFSRCGDGINDSWHIHFPCEPENFDLTIYDRWGNPIYTTPDYNFSWMATENAGSLLSAGVYYYFIEFTYLHNTKTLKGCVMFTI